jgi:hypothetical protein
MDLKKSMFCLRRERTHSRQAATYVWTWFRRQAVCTNLRLSVQICVPKIFKQQSEHSKIMTIIYLINQSTSKLFNLGQRKELP